MNELLGLPENCALGLVGGTSMAIYMRPGRGQV
jgi:hypothetical protein